MSERKKKPLQIKLKDYDRNVRAIIINKIMANEYLLIETCIGKRKYKQKETKHLITVFE